MLTIPLNALRTFEAVASHMSFAKGAEALHVSPAAVSSQIRLLEQRLKQPLFHRQGRQITLTEAGRKLLPGVQRGLTELRQAVQAVGTDRSEGVLNVSAMQSLLQKWMLPRLADFYKAHPEIDLRVNADNGLVNFQQSDFHAGIRFGPGKWLGLKAEKLMDDWILPVCSPEMLREIGPVKTIQDLQGHDLFFVESGIMDAWFRVVGDSGKESHWPLLNDTLSILMAAEQGQGIALSRWSLAARDIEAGRLVRPIDTVVKTDWSYYFVSPPHFFNLPKVKLFRQWLQDHCARFPAPE
ncbi:MAG TPA: transcriptional regulator GcvA [Xanthomonadales bacterium]|nr:transcriptional regulator GcvA [Xanthomonadales bacterium]